jgi:multidrug efflux pump subunit AcrA (membrane-fusion protein)
MPSTNHCQNSPVSREGTLVSRVTSWAVSIGTTTALAVIGWYGHATHWKFQTDASHLKHGTAHESPAASPGGGAGNQDTAGDIFVRFPSREVVERTGIQVVPMQRRSMVDEIPVNGFVTYDERRIAHLSTRVSGSVWRVEKHLGDAVRKGDILLVIDSHEVGQAKAEFLNALVVFETRREQLAILEEARAAVLGRQLREVRAALREARNHLTNAEQALVNLGFEMSIADYEPLDDDQRAARIRTLGLPAAIVAGRDGDRVSSNLLPLYAPFDGVVVGREAVVGEVVEAAKPIFEIADVSTMLLQLSVSKEDAARVALGQPLRFRPDGSRDEISSHVSWISTEVDEATRTLAVRAEAAADLRPGASRQRLHANTFGRGEIEIGRRDGAVVVPANGLQWDGRQWVVFVPVDDTTFQARPVEPGLRSGDVVEIVGPTAADPALTSVVGAGSHVLKSQILLRRIGSGKVP